MHKILERKLTPAPTHVDIKLYNAGGDIYGDEFDMLEDLGSSFISFVVRRPIVDIAVFWWLEINLCTRERPIETIISAD